jgi:hypothetical protein
MPDAPDLAAFLRRLALAIAEERVRFTWKADDEVAELGWSDAEALLELAALSPADHRRTEPSRAVDFTLILPQNSTGISGSAWPRTCEAPS